MVAGELGGKDMVCDDGEASREGMSKSHQTVVYHCSVLGGLVEYVYISELPLTHPIGSQIRCHIYRISLTGLINLGYTIHRRSSPKTTSPAPPTPKLLDFSILIITKPSRKEPKIRTLTRAGGPPHEIHRDGTMGTSRWDLVCRGSKDECPWSRKSGEGEEYSQGSWGFGRFPGNVQRASGRDRGGPNGNAERWRGDSNRELPRFTTIPISALRGEGGGGGQSSSSNVATLRPSLYRQTPPPPTP